MQLKKKKEEKTFEVVNCLHEKILLALKANMHRIKT